MIALHLSWWQQRRNGRVACEDPDVPSEILFYSQALPVALVSILQSPYIITTALAAHQSFRWSHWILVQ